MRSSKALTALLAVAGVLAGAPLRAQQQTTKPPAVPATTGKAEISGAALDSLNVRYLSGADVII